MRHVSGSQLSSAGSGGLLQGCEAKAQPSLSGSAARATTIAAQVARDLPDFTVHDITHLDALWSLAEKIAGKGVTLTPVEAFVLGGAFLAHDLGMGLAAYPEGIEAPKKKEIWKDSISQVLKNRLGRTPSVTEIDHPDEKDQEAAKAELLRELHAGKAKEIARDHWQSPKGGARYYLIDNPEIRQAFGGSIGEIAASHHWPLAEVRGKFHNRRSVGAPAGFPGEWTLDLVKLACLMRAADGAHLDALRAPLFLRALRNPAGLAADHWEFEGKLNQPTVESNRLVYTANAPGFSYAEAPAWWLCLDTLRMVDEQLGQIDELFVNLATGYRFEARGVKGVWDLDDFSQLVLTDGWEPVDTKIHVTDVATLVRSLGGKELYGEDARYVPLRELIQNGCDAVRARRLLQEEEDDWGKVTVRLGADINTDGVADPWIEIEDNGVGMSARVLKGALLDFGVSFWGSREMREEYPGLLGKAFESIGKYGIGFFSVFMWGDRVRVTTRRYDQATVDTRVLTFDAGLNSRPILRRAQRTEQLNEGGTRVRVYCPQAQAAYLKESADTWVRRLGWLCPTLDVNLFCVFGCERARLVVSASDWVDMDGRKFLERLYYYQNTVESLGVDQPEKLLASLKDSSGRAVGRAARHPVGGAEEKFARDRGGHGRRDEDERLLPERCRSFPRQEHDRIPPARPPDCVDGGTRTLGDRSRKCLDRRGRSYPIFDRRCCLHRGGHGRRHPFDEENCSRRALMGRNVLDRGDRRPIADAGGGHDRRFISRRRGEARKAPIFRPRGPDHLLRHQLQTPRHLDRWGATRRLAAIPSGARSGRGASVTHASRCPGEDDCRGLGCERRGSAQGRGVRLQVRAFRGSNPGRGEAHH